MKNILVIGGRQFLGRRTVELLLEEAQSTITLFNRGRSHPELFTELEHISGDRETNDIEKITAREWDVVIDFCGYYPASIQRLVEGLKGKVGRYIFISTLSVFDFQNIEPGLIDEDAALLGCTEEEAIDKSMMSYGQRKAECERRILAATDLDSIILRPSIIYGNYDWTDRLYYWLYRAHSGAEYIIPNQGQEMVTLSDQDDLSRMIIAACSVNKHRQVYNTTTHKALPLCELLSSVHELCGTQNQARSLDYESIQSLGLQPGVDLPLCFGIDLAIDNQRLLDDFNFRCRDLGESLQQQIDYYTSIQWPIPKTGMSLEKEAEVLTRVKG